MTKNKNAKKNPKQRKQKRGAVKPKVLANNVSPLPVRTRNPPKRKFVPKQNHVRSICSITDPFCPASKGSRWVDGASANTITEQFRGSFNLTASALGNTAAVFTPSAPTGYINYTSTTATTYTLQSTWTQYKVGSMVQTYGCSYRVVSFGCILRCVASATNASGLLTLGTTGVPPAASSTYSFGTEQYNECVVKAIQPGLEVSWLSRPIGSTAHEFKPIDTAVSAAQSSPDWSVLVVEVTGAPASTVMINVEWFMNVEFNPQQNTALTPLCANGPASTLGVSAAQKTRTSIGSFIEGGIAQVEATVAKHASSAISSLLDDPLEALSFLFT
jgi:hypothetical protein